MHGGHAGIPGGPYFLQPIKKFQGIKTRRAADTGPGMHRAQHGGDEAVDMKQGHDIETSIRRSERQGLGNIARRCTDISLA